MKSKNQTRTVPSNEGRRKLRTKTIRICVEISMKLSDHLGLDEEYIRDLQHVNAWKRKDGSTKVMNKQPSKTLARINQCWHSVLNTISWKCGEQWPC